MDVENYKEIKMKKVILILTLFISFAVAKNDSNGFMLGLDAGMAYYNLNHKVKDSGVKNIQKQSSFTPNANVKLGISNESGYIGGRFYGEGGFFSMEKFHIIVGGVNVDLLVNFTNNEVWNFGAFVGLGGGMYLALFRDKSLSSAGKVPLSPIGWANTGLRLKYNHHAFEVLLRVPYIYAAIYKYSGSKQGNSGTQSIDDNYFLKAGMINIGYVYTF